MNMKSKGFFLGKHWVEPFLSPYIIAEIGSNHEASLVLAKEQMAMAKEGGAHAVKFQSFQASHLVVKNASPNAQLQYDFLKKYERFSWEDYQELSEYAQSLKIDFASTPFDLESIDALEKYLPFYKISSGDIDCLPLLEKIASKGKTILLSTGASEIEEIKKAVKFLRQGAKKEIILLHCIMNYPCEAENVHLGMIQSLAKSFTDCFVGYSDHSMATDTMLCMILAVAFGACVLEKHFTHDKSIEGNDHIHSMDLKDLKYLSEQLKMLKTLTGTFQKRCIDSEKPIQKEARRSLVCHSYMPKGSRLKKEDLLAKRPSLGISSMSFYDVLGKSLLQDKKENTILRWEDLENGSS